MKIELNYQKKKIESVSCKASILLNKYCSKTFITYIEKIENSKAEKRKIEEEEEDSEMEILPPEREFLVHHSGTVGFVSGHGFIFWINNQHQHLVFCLLIALSTCV